LLLTAFVAYCLIVFLSTTDGTEYADVPLRNCLLTRAGLFEAAETVSAYLGWIEYWCM